MYVILLALTTSDSDAYVCGRSCNKIVIYLLLSFTSQEEKCRAFVPRTRAPIPRLTRANTSCWPNTSTGPLLEGFNNLINIVNLSITALAKTGMCHRIPCIRCHKPTWIGCGRHIDHALGGVEEGNRCHCKAYTQKMHDEQNGGASCSLQ
jgi:hypothetical protein